jgi:hypothetical protein
VTRAAVESRDGLVSAEQPNSAPATPTSMKKMADISFILKELAQKLQRRDLTRKLFPNMVSKWLSDSANYDLLAGLGLRDFPAREGFST